MSLLCDRIGRGLFQLRIYSCRGSERYEIAENYEWTDAASCVYNLLRENPLHNLSNI